MTQAERRKLFEARRKNPYSKDPEVARAERRSKHLARAHKNAPKSNEKKRLKKLQLKSRDED